MTAVKPTAERRFSPEKFDAWANSLEVSECGSSFPGMLRNDHIAMLRQAAADLRASLASHRQPESALGGARNARSIEAERVVERLTRIHNEVFPRIGPGPNYEHGEYFDELTRGIGRDVLDAIELLRAYAKLLRGERE